MKLKYYLRGLGTGIFVTALILSIAFDVRLSKLNSTNKNGTENKSESVSETTSPESTSYSENANANVTETETEGQSTNTDELTENLTEEVTTETETLAPETDISTAMQQSATVTIDIYSGMSSNKVAARLEELGVVEDADDFNNYMYSRHIENSIRIGRFDISQNATYDEIISIITARP